MSFELATGTFPVEAADCPGGLQMIMSTTGIKIVTADGSRTVHNIVYQSSTDQLARAEAGQQNERHGRREELTVQSGATMALLAQLERKGSGNRQPSAPAALVEARADSPTALALVVRQQQGESLLETALHPDEAPPSTSEIALRTESAEELAKKIRSGLAKKALRQEISYNKQRVGLQQAFDVRRTVVAGIWVAFFRECQQSSCGQAVDSDGSGELEFSELRLLLQALGKEFTDAELRDQMRLLGERDPTDDDSRSCLRTLLDLVTRLRVTGRV